MAKREVATRHVGSVLGFLWIMISQLVFIGVFWFVFSVGFRVAPTKDAPFIVWFTAGFAVWNLFGETLSSSTRAITGYSNLITKTIFPAQILPLVKVISNLVNHGVLILILLGLILLNKVSFSWYYFQASYYLLCMIIFMLGLGWAVSALNVFIKDTAHFVSAILRVGFWATPIFWDLGMIPERFRLFFQLNPVYYIVQGYRDSFIYSIPFWAHPYLTLYFWSVAAFTFVVGAFIFKQLRPQFADVL